MARTSEDPRRKDVPQPFPDQHQAPPGHEKDMQPRPDYGEATYRGSGKLEGKKALITGGDSGIGRAVALAFAREGADVAIAYLPEEEDDARETARIVEAQKRRCLAIAGDIRDPQHCRALVTRMVKELGAIDVLVNNAGYQMTHQSFVEMKPEEIDRVFRTNVYAMFYLTQAAVPHMKPGATIVNSASIPGVSAQALSPALRVEQGRDRCVHQGPLAGARGERHPRQRGRARPGVDAAHPLHHGGRALRRVDLAQARGAARRDGADLCTARMPGLELCHRHGVRRYRRATAALKEKDYWLRSKKSGPSKRSQAARAAWRFLAHSRRESPRLR